MLDSELTKKFEQRCINKGYRPEQVMAALLEAFISDPETRIISALLERAIESAQWPADSKQ
jgi:hypothetical protein